MIPQRPVCDDCVLCCRSAPLSATESLIGDWLEVSGMKTLDSKEYEALERELGLESPMLHMNDLVPSPS